MDLIKVPKVDVAEVAQTQSAREEFAKLSNRLKLLQKITAANITVARDMAAAGRRWMKLVESSRVVVKKQPLALVNGIDDMARSLSDPIEAEVKRIESGITAEIRRQKQEADEVERRARENQRQEQLKADAARAAAAKQAETIVDPVKAQQVLDLGASAAKIIESRVFVPAVVVPAKIPGITTRKVWKYKVTDLWVLANHDKNLVRIEAAAGAIRTKIDEGMRTCPGLEIWEEDDSRTSAR